MSEEPDKTFTRRVRYKLYPNDSQKQRLKHLKGCHKELYNALLEQRITRYKRFGERLTEYDQNNEITALRQADPKELGRADNPWAGMNAQALQATSERVEKAFRNFFRKHQDPDFTGDPGFPRYKSFHRYNGWAYKQNGWKVSTSPELPTGTREVKAEAHRFIASSGKNGYVYLQEVGKMQCRGRARQALRQLASEGEVVVKRPTLLDKADGWYLSVVVECKEMPGRKRKENHACGLDWGVNTLATLAVEGAEATWQEIANPRLLDQAQEKLKNLQQKLSRKRESGSSGKNSRRYRKLRSRLARAHQEVAQRRKDLVHKLSAFLVAHFSLIGTEDLDILAMTASARGTAESPGTKVKQKAGLNRAILDTAPGAFMRLLACKAEEADTRVLAYDPQEFEPTQTCHQCGEVNSHELEDRVYRCGSCGLETNRDYNAARVLLNLALHGSAAGRAPAVRGGGNSETFMSETPPLKREVHLA